MLAYSLPTDLVDDHLAMGESQAINCVKRFAVGIVQVFSEKYLRAPNAQDMARLLELNRSRGFQVCLAQLIACIRVGRIVLPHDMDNLKATKKGFHYNP